MNKLTCQQLLDDLVADITDTLRAEPTPDVCRWWRGRVSGVTDTARAICDGLDYSRCDAALDALYDFEEHDRTIDPRATLENRGQQRIDGL